MDGSHPPRVLLVGLDRYGLQACARLGFETAVICGASSWDQGLVPVPESVRVLQVDQHSSPEAVLMALRRAGLTDGTLDAIYTSDEWSLVTVSLMAGYLGLPGLDPATAVLFRDKILQKEVVRAAGMSTARTLLIDDIHDVSHVRDPGFGRAVLKPVAGAATALTSTVANMAELRSRGRAYREQRTAQRTFVLEEYISGEEWFVDGVLYEGEMLFCAVGRYGDPCLTTLNEGRPMLLRHFCPDTDEWAYQRALPAVLTALKALGLHSGPFHMELFHDPDTGTLTFGECAARRGGALIHEQVLTKFQVDLAEASILTALGRRPDIRPEIRSGVVGGTFLTGLSGTLLACPPAAEITALQGVEYARIERPVGSHLASGLASTNQRIGQCLVVADSVEQLQERVTAVQDWFAAAIRVLPDGLRPRELWDLQCGSGSSSGDAEVPEDRGGLGGPKAEDAESVRWHWSAR